MNKKDFTDKDRFAKFIGCEILESSDNHAKVQIKIEERHLNGIDTAQGGVIFTLADFAFAIASNFGGNIVTAINVDISYVKASRKGDILTAEASPQYTDTKIPIYNVNVTNQNNELIAVFKGTGYRLK